MKLLFIILAVILLLIVFSYYYFLKRLGDPVDAARSDSYYHHARKKLIVYAPMGNWFELGYYETEADPATFTVMAREYGKDKNSVFWKGKKQPVDHHTFKLDYEAIPKDDERVYYEKYSEHTLKVVAGADPKTYCLYKDGAKASYDYWHQDNNSFFVGGYKIDVDRKTFVRLNTSLGIDTNYVYAIVRRNDTTEVLQKLHKPEGEASAISENYARIGNVIIFSNWKTDFASINFSVIDSIRELNERNIVVNGQLVHDGVLFAGVDVHTWEELGRDYFKDQNSVYFDGRKINYAKAATFSILTEGYSKDDQHVFYHDKKLDGANPASFKYEFNTGIGTDGKLVFKEGVAVRGKENH